MSNASLLADVQAFVGCETNAVIDKIRAIAASHRCSVEIVEMEFSPNNIDVERNRLDVRQSADGKIISFNIG